MRKLILVLVPAFLAACGSDSKDTPTPTALGGTVGGRAFAPVDVRAISAGAASCEVDPALIPTAGIRALALEITSYADACGDFGQCRPHANAQSVTVVLAKLNPFPPFDEPALPPGTYTVNASPLPAFGQSGALSAFAQALATGAAPTCAGTPSLSVQGGTVQIVQAAGSVSGRVDLTFQDGSRLAGDFSAPICAAGPSVCSLAKSIAASITQQSGTPFVSICTQPPAACVP